MGGWLQVLLTAGQQTKIESAVASLAQKVKVAATIARTIKETRADEGKEQRNLVEETRADIGKVQRKTKNGNSDGIGENSAQFHVVGNTRASKEDSPEHEVENPEQISSENTPEIETVNTIGPT